MSAIAAIFHRDGSPTHRDHIERAARSLSMYGPEKQVIRTSGSIAFGYNHFTNTPESRGQYQPVTTRDKRYTLVFDGRLANRDDLARALDIKPVDLRMMSDAALALACWQKWGSDGLNKWVGEFAFIVWDESEQKLQAVRDHFGYRSLYYHIRDNRVVIATMPKGIHAIGDVPREIDEHKIAHALCQSYTQLNKSFFKDIWQLPPAYVLTVSAKTHRLQRYYDLCDHIKPINLARDDDYIEAGEAVLNTSVRACLRAPGPVGAFMSGGFDSSTVSVFAANQLAEKGQRLSAFTSIPEAGWDGRINQRQYGDETPFVKAIADMHPNMELNLVDAAGRGQYHFQEQLLMAADGPTRNALNVTWIHTIMEQAQSQGIRVMLDGSMGNMTYSYDGIGLYPDLWRQRHWLTLFKELKAISPDFISFIRHTGTHLIYPIVPNWVWSIVERLRGNMGSERTRWLRYINANPEFAKAHNVKEDAAKHGFNFFGAPPPNDRDLWMFLLTYMAADLMSPLSKAHQAMFNIEMRDPFADRRLVEWCLGVPKGQYRRDGKGKWFIRRLMKDRLPQSVLYNEAGKGKQFPDWHMRMSRDMPKMQADFQQFRQDPDMARMIDIERMEALLKDWPEQTIIDTRDDRLFYLQVNIPMALQVGRFIQREKGTNFAADRL